MMGVYSAFVTHKSMDYKGIITLEPGKRGGQPVIRGMRITVYDVLKMLASGMTQEQIVEDYPELTPVDIQAVLSYASERERSVNALVHETTLRPKSLSQARQGA